jgi:hypothetical protein
MVSVHLPYYHEEVGASTSHTKEAIVSTVWDASAAVTR